MVAQCSETTPDRTPFWFKPVSTFGLFKDHDVKLKFTYVGRSRSSLAPYRLSAGSFQAVASLVCPDRERLMEQPVSSGHNSSCETETQATFRSHEHTLCQIDASSRNLHGGRPFRFKWLINASTLARRCRYGWGRPSHWSASTAGALDQPGPHSAARGRGWSGEDRAPG